MTMTHAIPTQLSYVIQRANAALLMVVALIIAPFLTACQGAPKTGAVNAGSPQLSGGLLVVRLLNRMTTPRALILDVAVAGQQETTAISGRVQQSMPGQFSDYLMPLALPRGSYVLRNLRSAEVPASDPSATFAELDLPLSFSQVDPVYLGRIVVRSKAGIAARQDLSIEDKFDEDILGFRTTVPELRKAEIGRKVLDALLISSAKAVGPSRESGSMEVALIDGQSAMRLVEPARSAFGRYMQTALPRAFATNDFGSYGFASGRLAVDNAMKNCVARAKASSAGRSTATDCQLFSVDQILMTADSCKATANDGNGASTLSAGCATTNRKKP